MPNSSFTDALHTKYGEEVNEEVNGALEIFVVGSASGRASPSGRLVLPKTLTLNCLGIDSAGCHATIKDLCHSIEELDLAQNNFNDLTEVNNIISLMPNLWFLNLSHNDLGDADPVSVRKTESIRNLVLNHTYASWPVVSCLLNAMPNIHELHLSLNSYTTVALDKQYANIRHLYMCGNPFHSWKEVTELGRAFPNLESLVLADTHLESIPDTTSWSSSFRNLRSVNMNNCLMTEWSDVDRLNNFTKLDEVRLQGVPVLEEFDEKERRQHLISRLPSITRLNGSEIMQKEKDDAERAFIRYFMDKRNKPKRFYDLEEKHGRLDPLVEIDLSPKRTAKVGIRYHETEKTSIVNLQNSVQDLKVQLSEICGLTPTKMRVFYVDREIAEIQGPVPEELRYNSKKLYTYNIQDGDEFIVDSK